MRIFFLFLLLLPAQDAFAETDQPVAIAIHGGAGTLTRENMTPELETAYRETLTRALRAGHQVLVNKGSALDGVVTAITLLESSSLFNAGVGAVMTWEERHELDASIMRGEDLSAGAVAGVRQIASPITLARAVMEQSPHVLLSGSGAEQFAQHIGMPLVPNETFTTPRRLQQLQRAKRKLTDNAQIQQVVTPDKWGTVGAVALDAQGNLAAGTSTGGMTAKRWGRIGDSPVIGAGTYADNRSCAVSATGHGEYFIRYNVAADICARVRYQKLDIMSAGKQVIFDELKPAGGTGGVIIMDPQGRIAMPFNTSGMYRGRIDIQGNLQVDIFQDAAQP